MRETSHPEMCPCVTSAAVELASQAAMAETSPGRSPNTPGIEALAGVEVTF